MVGVVIVDELFVCVCVVFGVMMMNVGVVLFNCVVISVYFSEGLVVGWVQFEVSDY